jgi:hypothetical protein
MEVRLKARFKVKVKVKAEAWDRRRAEAEALPRYSKGYPPWQEEGSLTCNDTIQDITKAPGAVSDRHHTACNQIVDRLLSHSKGLRLSNDPRPCRRTCLGLGTRDNMPRLSNRGQSLGR